MKSKASARAFRPIIDRLEPLESEIVREESLLRFRRAHRVQLGGDAEMLGAGAKVDAALTSAEFPAAGPRQQLAEALKIPTSQLPHLENRC